MGDYYHLKKEFVTKEEAEIIDFFYPYDISEDYYSNYCNDLEYFIDANGEEHRRHFVTYEEFFDCIDYHYYTYEEENEKHNVAVFGYHGYDG